MTELAELLRAALSGTSLLALPLALAGGVLTGLNPCCLPIYPAAAAACCASRECAEGGRSSRLDWRSAIGLCLGLAAATTALGVAAAIGGRTMTALSGRWLDLLALVPIAAGLHLLGVVKLPLPSLRRLPPATGFVSAVGAGALLALVFGPCGTPILASLLAVVAYQGSVVHGALLLFAYGLGIALPVVALGSAAASVAARLDARGWRPIVDRATGAAMIGIGLYVVATA